MALGSGLAGTGLQSSITLRSGWVLVLDDRVRSADVTDVDDDGTQWQWSPRASSAATHRIEDPIRVGPEGRNGVISRGGGQGAQRGTRPVPRRYPEEEGRYPDALPRYQRNGAGTQAGTRNAYLGVIGDPLARDIGTSACGVRAGVADSDRAACMGAQTASRSPPRCRGLAWDLAPVGALGSLRNRCRWTSTGPRRRRLRGDDCARRRSSHRRRRWPCPGTAYAAISRELRSRRLGDVGGPVRMARRSFGDVRSQHVHDPARLCCDPTDCRSTSRAAERGVPL